MNHISKLRVIAVHAFVIETNGRIPKDGRRLFAGRRLLFKPFNLIIGEIL